MGLRVSCPETFFPRRVLASLAFARRSVRTFNMPVERVHNRPINPDGIQEIQIREKHFPVRMPHLEVILLVPQSSTRTAVAEI